MSRPPFELIDIVVRAGAGAGKTTELTERVIELALNYYTKHQRYPHFVVTTFTRKATQELKERLLKEAMKRDNPGLVDFIKRPSYLHISTIHGVLSLFLSRYGSALGLSPRLNMISNQREQFLIKRLIRESCEGNAEFNTQFQNLLEVSEFSDLLQAFKQYFCVRTEFGDSKAFAPKDFSAITAEMSQQILEKMNALATQIRVDKAPETWQALASNYEQTLEHAKSLKPEIAAAFWRANLESLPSPRKTKDISETFIDARDEVKDLIKEFTSWNTEPDYWKEHQRSTEQFKFCADILFSQMLDQKLSSGEVTMQDLESLSLVLARQHPQVAKAFSKSWDYWLIDEYQDTSPAQVELLRALTGESKTFVVGDPQQSIYLFRGARAEVFIEKEIETKNSQGHLYSKLTNYRSDPGLLLFFNHLFTKLSSQFQSMLPHPEKAHEKSKVVADILIVPAPEKKEDQEEKGTDLELEAVLFRIQELVQHGAQYEDVCVLSRNNKDLEDLAWMAKERQIPVQVFAAGKYFERREIVDALSLLKFLSNPHDNLNLLQILRSPAFRVSDQQLADWCHSISGSYWQTFQHQSSVIITKLQEALQTSQRNGLGATWTELLVQRGYFQFAYQMDPSGRREANLWKLIQMVRLEERRPRFSYLDFLKNLNLQAQNSEESDQSDAVPVIEPQKVHLMTVHGSKGLEFPHVIVPRLSSSAPFPKTEFFMNDEKTGQWTLSLTDPEEGKKIGSLAAKELLDVMKRRQSEESDRLLYVALTRAKDSVTLIMDAKPDKNSWATKISLQKLAGIFNEEHFTYQVREGIFKAGMAEQAHTTEKRMKERFSGGNHQSFQLASVTEILENQKITTEQNKKTEVSDVSKALLGVDVHRIFENLKYHQMRNPNYRWQDLLKEVPVAHHKALEYLAGDQAGRWLQVIQNGEVEYGLSVKLGQKLVQGQIDLWGQDASGQYWVVDYKTGSPKYQDKAFEQLMIYTWALQKMRKLDPTKAVQLAVIYPFSNLTVTRPAPSSSDLQNTVQKIVTP